MSGKVFEVKLKLLENYIFQIDFGDMGYILSDEPEPLGNSEGPNPVRLLAASVGNCLAASMIFAIRKFKEDPGEVTAKVTGEPVRVDGRWRITNMKVDISLGKEAGSLENIDKVLAQFEDFCVVTQSVRDGIDVEVNVFDSSEQKIH